MTQSLTRGTGNIATNPENAHYTGLIQQAHNALSVRNYKAAHAVAMDALQHKPDAGEPLFVLAMIAADHANHVKAIELFDAASVRGVPQARALAQKARSLIALNRREEALDAAETAISAGPADAMTWDTLGVVLSRAGLHERAVAFYEEATRRAPNVANLFYNLGSALQFLGRMDAARAAYRRCLELDPKDVRALTGIVQITRQSDDANELGQLIPLFERLPEADANSRLHVGHAIAKAYEDLGAAEQAIDWLHRAKAAKRAEIAYDPAMDRAIFDAAIATLDLPPTEGFADSSPIFVVGMPRTGTTLIDRILSSHSQVRSVGELTDFGLHLKRMAGTPSRHVLDAETLNAASSADMAALGRTYTQSVARAFGDGQRLLDKMPLNAIYAPLILRALPNARVICLRRHPADTVLSNYRQLFATGFSYYNYAYDLADTARYAVGFDRMIRAFSERLPEGRFTEVVYENVVDDIETEARRLLDFCGLPFERACVDFHENAAPVATASSAQVRQPLYRSALARWRRYEPWLGPALEVLREAGLIQEP